MIHSRPPRVEYLLTERGQMLETLISALEHWAATA
jgi:DNA-binding HxlR family transcriptional regulator